MRVLLRHVKTGRYYQNPGNWTARAEEALCFSNTIQALSRVAELKLDEVEILLAFDDPRYNIRLPVRGRTT